jgi:hypothetical protein
MSEMESWSKLLEDFKEEMNLRKLEHDTVKGDSWRESDILYLFRELKRNFEDFEHAMDLALNTRISLPPDKDEITVVNDMIHEITDIANLCVMIFYQTAELKKQVLKNMGSE